MAQDNIVELQIGQGGSLVSGDIFVDYTTNSISGPGLAVNVAGQSLGVNGLTLVHNSDGTYAISGATTSLGGMPVTSVNLFLPSTAPGSVVVQAATLGVVTSQTVAVASSPVVCFASGTLIRTARGDVAVEDLRVGDRAMTASVRHRPITWIGHKVLSGQGRALPHDQQPVRIRAGAFGPGLPARDLFLSPGHPVLVGADADHEGGHLVPIMCLINGTTIDRVPVASVTYWHVELDDHDILLAEGLPAESYLDWGDRAFFSEAPAYALANPDFVAPGLAGRCRPVAVDGPVVEAERRRLDAMFIAALAAHCGWTQADDVAFAVT